MFFILHCVVCALRREPEASLAESLAESRPAVLRRSISAALAGALLPKGEVRGTAAASTDCQQCVEQPAS